MSESPIARAYEQFRLRLKSINRTLSLDQVAMLDACLRLDDGKMVEQMPDMDAVKLVATELATRTGQLSGQRLKELCDAYDSGLKVLNKHLESRRAVQSLLEPQDHPRPNRSALRSEKRRLELAGLD